MRRKTDILIVLFAALMLSGCRLHRPDDVISPKKLEAFLYDYHLAQAIAQDLPRDQRYTTPAYIDWAYEKNGLSKEEVDRALVWYTRYPKELAKIYKHLSNRIDDEWKLSNRIRSQIEKKAFAVESGDSVDLWYLNRTCLLNTSDYMSRVSFLTNSDTTFHLGDTVVWTLNSTFLTPSDNESRWAYLALWATYGDSVSTVDTLLKESGKISLSLVLDKSKSMNSIRASIYYTDTLDNRESMLLATDIDMVRYHYTDTVSKSLTPNNKESMLGPAELGAGDGGSNGDIQ